MRDFNPDWVSAPGETLADIMYEKSLSFNDVSNLLGISLKSLDSILLGTGRVTPEIAHKLEVNIGGTYHFWVQRQLDYDHGLEKIHGNKDQRS